MCHSFVISGIVDRATRARYTHQVIDHAQLLRPLVKASFEIECESAGPTVARALALALTEPMGRSTSISPRPSRRWSIRSKGHQPDHDPLPCHRSRDPAIQRLAHRLATAERPLILAGFEAARAVAGPHILRLAETIGAPVLTTYKGKGLIPETHPLSLGGAGLSPLADTIMLGLMRRADLILMIGYDPIEMRLGWLDPVVDPGKIVEMTAAAPDHAMHHAATRFVAIRPLQPRRLQRPLRRGNPGPMANTSPPVSRQRKPFRHDRTGDLTPS